MAKEVLGYHVYSTAKGGVWLADDEQSWTSNFIDSVEFGSPDLAADIGEREHARAFKGTGTIYVMACMGS